MLTEVEGGAQDGQDGQLLRMYSGWQSAMAEISVNRRAGRKEGMRQLEPWAMISKTLIRPAHCTLHTAQARYNLPGLPGQEIRGGQDGENGPLQTQ